MVLMMDIPPMTCVHINGGQGRTSYKIILIYRLAHSLNGNPVPRRGHGVAVGVEVHPSEWVLVAKGKARLVGDHPP